MLEYGVECRALLASFGVFGYIRHLLLTLIFTMN